MRRLIYVPIVHSEADMGTMAGPLKQAYIAKVGLTKWKEHVRIINQMWKGIYHRLRELRLDPKKVRIYQDGLPLCGKEMAIVQDVAAKGSENYKIVLELVQKGAHVEGTEDVRLLMQEYHMTKSLVEAGQIKDHTRLEADFKKKAMESLHRRDQFIAKRIEQTLQDSETGLCFMGLVHEVDRYLPKNIQVSYLIHRLPFQA